MQAQEAKKTTSGYKYDAEKHSLTVWGRVRPNGYNDAKRALDSAIAKTGNRDTALETLTVEMRKAVNRVYDFVVTFTNIDKPDKDGDFVLYSLQSGLAVNVAKLVRELIDSGMTNAEINTILHKQNWNACVPDGTRKMMTTAERQESMVSKMTPEQMAEAANKTKSQEELIALVASLQAYIKG